MRSVGEIVVTEYDLAPDLKLFDVDPDQIIRRLNDPSWYQPDKRIVLALTIIDRLKRQP